MKNHDFVPDSVGIKPTTSSEVYKFFYCLSSTQPLGPKVYNNSQNPTGTKLRHLRKPQLISDDPRNRLEFIANDQDDHLYNS